MPDFLTVADSNYARGMNTVDDPKALQDGECAGLVNAMPGYPLTSRRGHTARFLDITGEPVGRQFYMNWGEASQYLLYWTREGGPRSNTYRLYATLVVEDSGVETFLLTTFTAETVDVRPRKALNFDFVKIYDIVYIRASNNLAWALEFDDGWINPREIPQADVEFGLAFDDPLSAIGSATDGNHAVPIAYGYSITLVRRTGEDATSEAIEHFSTGLIETPEQIETRGSFVHAGNTGSYNTVQVSGNINSALAVEYGFTHIRLYRTLNMKTLADLADSAERYWLADIPINGDSFTYSDQTPDSILKGEPNLLNSAGYTLFPSDGYRMCYHRDRLFVLGEKGSVYFSEIPGGDGGADAQWAQLSAQKYALMFNPLYYRIPLDTEEQTPVIGVRALNDDLFFFKEDSVFMLIGGDPFGAPVRKINDIFGCPFPDTLITAMIEDEEVIFYLSGAGPMLIRSGGNTRLFTEYKAKGIWGYLYGELLRVARGDVEYCAAAFWNDTVWVFYKLRGRVARVFGYLSRNNAAGVFEVETARNSYSPRHLAVTDGNRAVTVCASDNGGGNYLVGFMGAVDYHDELPNGVKLPVVFRLWSRRMYPGPKDHNMSELFRAVAYCDFEGLDTFSLVVFNNRYSATFDYARDGVEGPHVWENNMPQPISALRNAVSFTLPVDFVGEYFQYMVEKEVQKDGAFKLYGVELDSLPRPQLDAEDFVPVTRFTLSGVCVASMTVYVGARAECTPIMEVGAAAYAGIAVTWNIGIFILPDMTQRLDATVGVGARAVSGHVGSGYNAAAYMGAAATGKNVN